MKYYPPYGSADPDASYVDKDVPGAVRGSAVPAKAIEKPQRELVDLLVKSGLVPADGLQLSQAVQAGKVNFAATAGTGNAIVATLTPAPPSLSLGLIVMVKILNANTGPATINLNGLGVRPIKTASGDDVVAGDLKVNSIIEFGYDGTNWRMLVTSPQSVATRALASGAYNLATGAIPNSIDNLTLLASALVEDYDNSGSLSGGIFTVPYDGVAHISISAYQEAALASAVGLGVFNNGVLVDSTLYNGNPGLDRTMRTIYTRVFRVAKNDRLQFGVACRNAALTGGSPPMTGTATIIII